MSRSRKLLKLLVKIALLGVLVVVLAIGGFTAALAIERSQTLGLPVPTGSYPVGRWLVDWVDPSRTDPLADSANVPRQLAVWIWYPAQAEPSAAPAPYLPPAWAQARNNDQGAGILIESNLARIVTHSVTDAPLASQPVQFPVLFMQPGMGPVVPDYTVFAENLASHGYVVVGLNPTYTSNLVVFADGRVALRSDKGTIPDSADAAQADQDANRIMAVWAQDVIFAMDQLQAIDTSDPGSPFYQRLDLAHTGIFGHSFGGATAIAVCLKDPRCKAGADLDGTPFSAEAANPIPVPFLFMTEDYTTACDPQNCAAIRQMASRGLPGSTYVLSVRGAAHFNFTDLALRQAPLVRPLFRAAGYTGSIDPARGEAIANAYLLAFFDQALKGIEAPLLKGPAVEYPEVTFEK